MRFGFKDLWGLGEGVSARHRCEWAFALLEHEGRPVSEFAARVGYRASLISQLHSRVGSTWHPQSRLPGLATLMQSFAITCLVTLLWYVIGYTLAFTPGTPYVGGLSRLFMNRVIYIKDVAAAAATKDTPAVDAVIGKVSVSHLGVTIPESVYSMFQLSGTGIFTSGVADRVFDTEPNSFNVHQAALTIDYQPKEGFGGLVNLTAGRDARVIASLGEATSNFDVTQAFVQYAHGPLTIIGGKFVTLAGAEVINFTLDTNYSRSILFGYAIPFSHTGARLTYAASDQLSVIVGVNNGWDQLQDANKQKTGELGVSFTPNKMFSMTVQGYSGVEQLSGGAFIGAGTHGLRSLIDTVGTYNATSQLTFILNVDWGQQENVTSLVNGTSIKAKWDGAAACANYQVDAFKVSCVVRRWLRPGET
jgi:putative OmpL-like beta-barrel porin-2